MQAGDRVMVLGDGTICEITAVTLSTEDLSVLYELLDSDGNWWWKRPRHLAHLPYPQQRSHFDEYQEGLIEGFAQRRYGDSCGKRAPDGEE